MGEAQWHSGLTNIPNHKEYRALSTKSRLRAYFYSAHSFHTCAKNRPKRRHRAWGMGKYSRQLTAVSRQRTDDSKNKLTAEYIGWRLEARWNDGEKG